MAAAGAETTTSQGGETTTSGGGESSTVPTTSSISPSPANATNPKTWSIIPNHPLYISIYVYEFEDKNSIVLLC